MNTYSVKSSVLPVRQRGTVVGSDGVWQEGFPVALFVTMELNEPPGE